MTDDTKTTLRCGLCLGSKRLPGGPICYACNGTGDAKPENNVQAAAHQTTDWRDAVISRLERELAHEKRHRVLLVEAMSEIKATVDGKSSQAVPDIIAGCIAELRKIGHV